MSESILVMKFGGTSVQDLSAMLRVADIVARRSTQPVVVVTSALAGATNGLIALTEAISAGDHGRSSDLLAQLRERHEAIWRRLQSPNGGTRRRFDAFMRALEQLVFQGLQAPRLSPAQHDALLAFGELLASTVLECVFRQRRLRCCWFDVRRVMRTDARFGRATPHMPEIAGLVRTQLLPLLEQNSIVVTQGFIGSTAGGETTTLGRGGSDYTAALLGAALGAEKVEIWTDVDGILTADPSLVPHARKIDLMTFAEAAELAYFGAKVLHPATILPAMAKNIRIIVRNTHNPEQPGTTILCDCQAQHRPGVKSIAYKEGITVISITSARMLMAHGFLHKVFAVFDEFETAVDLVATSEVSVSMTVDQTGRLADIVRVLKMLGEVEVLSKQAIVCLVGNGLRDTPGIAAKAFAAIQPTNVRLISQGASKINLSFVIDEGDLPYAISRLHAVFFES